MFLDEKNSNYIKYYNILFTTGSLFKILSNKNHEDYL